MDKDVYQNLINVLNQSAIPLEGEGKYDSLLEKIGDARFVLIGEATHGTEEFYKARIEITQQLIKHKGFMAIAIEGDWPDAYRIHRYVQGKNENEDEQRVLNDFNRFPEWMWRNTTLPPFIKWLREHNDQLLSKNKIGFYGLDIYSLNTSINAVIQYLEKVDPNAAQQAKSRYSCFDHLNMDPKTYGYLTTVGTKKSCIKEVIEQLMDMQHNAFKYVKQDEPDAIDEYFYAKQNAQLVKDAEQYYRSMFEGRASSWNIRDGHMFETLNSISQHLEDRTQKPAKIIVWAHNTHVGDARATEMSERGEVNIGQLVRETYDRDAYLIGFSTHEGSVTAASEWGAPAACKTVMPGLAGSYEELFHLVKYPNFLLNLTNNPELEHYLKIPRLQRAIGVIYRPETERNSHYYFTRLPYQFDSIIHFDNTNAVKAL